VSSKAYYRNELGDLDRNEDQRSRDYTDIRTSIARDTRTTHTTPSTASVIIAAAGAPARAKRWRAWQRASWPKG